VKLPKLEWNYFEVIINYMNLCRTIWICIVLEWV